MEEKNTDNMKLELMSTPDLNEFLRANRENFSDRTVCGLLRQMFARLDISKAELARRSDVSEVYLHQIFSGRRLPSRSRLLCLAIGMGATVEDTQRLLRRRGLAELYAKDRRDAIILHGLLHQMTLDEVNNHLITAGEDALSATYY